MKDSTFAERKERGCAHTNLLGSFEHPLGQDRHQKTLAVAGSRDLAFRRDLSIIMPDVVCRNLSQFGWLAKFWSCLSTFTIKTMRLNQAD
jgi:hypothetical protein